MVSLTAALKNLDAGQKLFLKGARESFLITNVGGRYILTHGSRKVMESPKAALVAKAVLTDKRGQLRGVHPKADKRLLRSLGVNPEIVLP